MAQNRNKKTTYKSIRDFEDAYFPQFALQKKENAKANVQIIATKLAEDSLSSIKRK